MATVNGTTEAMGGHYDEEANTTDGWSYEWLDYPEHSRVCEDRGSWVHLTVKPVVYSVGIVGIILTVIVLSRKTMCTSTNCYLTALAAADLVVLLILTANIVTEHIMSCSRELEDYVFAFFHITTVFLSIAFFTSVWITVLLAVERYIAICHPMQAMSICTTKRARVVISLIFIVAVIVRFPNFFDMRLVEERLYDHNNDTYVKLVMEWVREDMYNNAVYSLIVPVFMEGLLPLLALAVLNARLVIEIRKSTRYLRYHLAADSRVQSIISHEETKITVMLIFIVVAFFLCQCPYMVYTSIMALNDYVFHSFDSATLQTFHEAALVILSVKSVFNFILHCWFSEKFWVTFKQIFCLRLCLPPQPLHVHNGCHLFSDGRGGEGGGLHAAGHRPSYYVTRETTC